MVARGTKRAGDSTSADSYKRRGPYALRACRACRHRKGKCDGRLPCAYCGNRAKECSYDSEYAIAINAESSTRSPEQPFQGQIEAGIPTGVPTAAIANRPTSSNQTVVFGRSSLAALVVNLRAQLNNLESIVQSYGDDTPHPEEYKTHSEPLGQAGQVIPWSSTRSSQPQATDDESDSGRPSSGGFCGPTSPDYSMNVVQMTLRERGYLEPSVHRSTLPSFNSDHVPPPTTGQLQPPYPVNDRHQLLQFRSYLTLQEAKEAVSLYSETVGELHPFVDIRNVQDQLDFWYSRDPSFAPDARNQQYSLFDLIIFNLMLFIASHAGLESSRARSADAMHSVFNCAVNASITCSTSSIKQVTIILLLGYCYIYQDEPRLALRMCGNAGRILMDLGIHDNDVIKHSLATESQRKEAYLLMCSVIVLDRQWSAMTGLPPSFSHSTFNLTSTYLTDSPYTMAMYKLIIISDRFNEPISLAAKGNSHEDDDTVELMEFQIRQWQTRFVGDQGLSDLEIWLAQPASIPPPWMLLLIFRAASIRSLLFRSYFFPGSSIEKSKRHILPATELLSHSIEAMSHIDRTTSIYHKHRPYYQHILASICALLFLLIGYTEDHRSPLSPHLPVDFDRKIRGCIQTASKLAEKYADISTAAHKLWRRISEVHHALKVFGVTTANAPPERNASPVTERTSSAALHSPAPLLLSEVREGVAAATRSTSYDPFDTSRCPEYPVELGDFLSSDFYTWGLPAWPLNSDSYLFH